MVEELELFPVTAEKEKKLDFSATTTAQMATKGSDSTAIRNAPKISRTKDSFADMLNMEEEEDSHGNSKTDSGILTVECSKDVKPRTEKETVKRRERLFTPNANLVISPSVAASADLQSQNVEPWA
ncbi:MAG: hypothetical protein MUF12_09725 [Sediminibacterium sp.]|jgi:hypothetical protein|nr:hypothetical protein [Sediminibacterium sp.]